MLLRIEEILLLRVVSMSWKHHSLSRCAGTFRSQRVTLTSESSWTRKSNIWAASHRHTNILMKGPYWTTMVLERDLRWRSKDDVGGNEDAFGINPSWLSLLLFFFWRCNNMENTSDGSSNNNRLHLWKVDTKMNCTKEKHVGQWTLLLLVVVVVVVIAQE